MMLIVVSLAASGITAEALSPPQKDVTVPTTATCQVVKREKTDRSVQNGLTPSARTLGDEPPASQIKAVAYSEQGCLKPIVVRDWVGALPAR